MHIRDARPGDAETVIALMQALAAHEGLTPYFQLTPAALVGYCMETPQRFHLLVADSDAQIVGYSTYMFQFSPWAGREYIFIDDIYVADNRRGEGVGFQLMSRIAQIALERDVETRWHVETSNRAALSFYTRLGADLRDKTIAYWSRPAMRALLETQS